MCHSGNLREGTSSHRQGWGSQKLRAADVRSGAAPGACVLGLQLYLPWRQ